MRTFARSDWLAARAQWETFGPEWNRLRQLAADRGWIYPPAGTPHDDRDAESPSQRSIVWRALEDNPAELYAIVGRSSSWSGVVDRIIGLEARLREDATYAEKDAALTKDEQPTHREAATAIKAILQRISDS